MQQIVEQTTYTTPPVPSYESCTPILPGERFHLRRGGFLGINQGDRCNADALRYFEVENDQLVAFLRERYQIPADALPTEEYLWIDENRAALRLIEDQILGVYKHSSLARCLWEHTEEGQMPSLIERGFLSSRWIARLWPGGTRPETAILYEERWNGKRQSYVVPFILVDAYGDYQADDGTMHNARAEGHVVVRQFRYEIEAVNKALYGLRFLDPPPPKKRWMPVRVRQKERGAPTQELTTSGSASDALATSKDDSMHAPAGIRGGYTTKTASSGSLDSSEKQDTIVFHGASMEKSTNVKKVPEPGKAMPRLIVSAEALRSAPWDDDMSIIGLVAQILAVPDPEHCDPEEWRRDWEEPARWLREATKSSAPKAAWDRTDPRWREIARHIYGMLYGPTWHAKEAARPFTPETLTLRHVVGTASKGELAGNLDGHNWRNVAKQLYAANDWYPEDAGIEIPPYDGPPLIASEDAASTVYEAGYAGVDPAGEPAPAEEISDQASEIVEASAESALAETATQDQADAAPAQDPAFTLSRAEAEELAAAMLQEYPILSVGLLQVLVDRYVVSIEIAEGQWIDFGTFGEWYAPLPEVARRIREAVQFGQARAGPPQVVEGGEGP